MIKNRYFKTTQGVDFELAIGKTLADYATVAAMVAGGSAFDLSAFVVDPTSPTPRSVPWGAAIPAADLKRPFFISFAEKTSGGKASIASVTPLIGSTISAELVPYKAPAFQVEVLTHTSGVIGETQLLSFKLIETTPLNQNLPSWDYVVPLTGGIDDAFTALATRINAAKEAEFFTAVAGATTITITSTDASRHFKLASQIIPSKADSTDHAIVLTATNTTKAYAGNGTLEHILELQKESNIKRGIGHYYPQQNATAAEFGLPIDVATGAATATWDIVVLTGLKSEASPTPVEQHVKKHYIYVAVPEGQGADVLALFS